MDSIFAADVRAHLALLRDALWASGGDRVSVFVGAGFSRNATALDPNAGAMPDWQALSRKLATNLAAGPEHAGLVAEMGSVAEGYTRLAQYFESKFGRTALDRFIVDEVGDSLFDPGPLHLALLRLPWREVFTTNWDTLLERSADVIPDRFYFPVAKQAELLTAGRPRITKLHGCVLRNHAFVFTEEDYRRYPGENAALIAVVKQALLEGPLCLFGFSGEDPNFRSWLGWVRDVMPKTHPIFLIDPMPGSIHDFKLKRLADQGVTVLAVGQAGRTPASSLKCVLEFLAEGAKRSWPGVLDAQAIGITSPNLLEVSKQLHVAAEAYPGWLVCPARYRGHIFRRIGQRRAKDFLGGSSGALGEQIMLLSARAVFSRYIGLGILQDDARYVDACLSVSLGPANESISRSLEAAVVKLVLARLDQARLDLEWSTYESLCKQVRASFLATHPSVQDGVLLNDVLWSLIKLDEESARSLLRKFSSQDPFSQLRAIALKIELSMVDDVERDIERLRLQITRLLRQRPFDERYASLEDAFRLLERNYIVIKQFAARKFVSAPDENDGRSQRRLALECDISGELRQLSVILEHPPSFDAGGEKLKKSFAAGAYKSTLEFKSDLPKGLAVAYLMARVPDDVGLLIAGRGVTFLVSAMQDAAKWLLHFDVAAFLSLTLRLISTGRNPSVVIEQLTRAHVARFSATDVQTIWPWIITAIQRDLAALPTDAASGRKDRLHALLALASRLVVILDESFAGQLLEVMLSPSWGSVAEDSERWAGERADCVVEVAHIIPTAIFVQRMRKAMRDVLESDRAEDRYFEFFARIAPNLDLRTDRVKDDGTIRLLIEGLNSKTISIRRRSAFLISLADELGLISAAAARKIGLALWSSGEWPDLGAGVNRYFVFDRLGSMRATAARSLLAELRSMSEPWDILATSGMLSWNPARESVKQWEASVQFSRSDLERISNAISVCAEERKSRRAYGSVDLAKMWRFSVGRVIAPLRGVSVPVMRNWVDASKESDLWRPTMLIDLVQHRYLPPTSIGEVFATAAGDRKVEWALVDLIEGIALGQHLDRSVFSEAGSLFQELTLRLRSPDAAVAAHALWAASALVGNQKLVIERATLDAWVSAALISASDAYSSSLMDRHSGIPDLRRASARLVAKIVSRDPEVASREYVAKAIVSFTQDPLPEIRREMAELERVF